jgi:site-specific DNA recombinase
MTTAAIYARVSSARQRDEQTIDSQTEALRTYARSTALEIPPEWVFEDEGYSGGTLVRPALERLRDLAAQVPVDVVLCYSPDRLSRRYAYQALLIEEFTRVGTEVRFLKGPKADTPEDELLLQFQGMIAEYEKAQIAERTRRGKAHRARGGSTSVLAGAPYGYRYSRRTEHSDASYEVVPEQAAVVREVFRLYVEEQFSIGDVTRWLTEHCVPTATGKARWDRSTVWGMLRNPAYAGRAAFGKTMRSGRPPRLTRRPRLQGRAAAHRAGDRPRPRDQWIEIAVPPLISEESYALAARRLEDNKHFASRRTKEASLLQGLVVCQRCGYAYYRTSTRTSSRKLYYYRCLGSDDWRYERGRVCESRPVRQDYLDEVVWTHVTALLADPSLIVAELDRRLEDLRAANPSTVERSRLERELTRTRGAVTRLVDAYQDGLLPLSELRSRTPPLRTKESSLHSQLSALEAQLVDQEAYLQLAETLESFLTRLRDAAEGASLVDRRRVLRLVVKEVMIDSERVVIKHSIPASRPDPTGGYLLRRGSQRRSLRRSLRLRPSPLLDDPCAQPLADETQDPSVCDPVLEELQQPRVIDRGEEVAEVRIEHPVHLLPQDPGGERIQRVVRAAPWPESVGEAQEVRLVDGVQNLDDRPLQDLVLQRGDAKRPLPPVRLRYVRPS